MKASTKSAPLTAAERKRLETLATELAAWNDAGIYSIGKLRAFIRLALEEGKTMSEIAGRAATPEYTEVLQAVLDLGPGRSPEKKSGAKLVKTAAMQGHGRKRTIALTAKGRRLAKRMSAVRLAR